MRYSFMSLCLFILFICSPISAYAQIVISEIMYDLEGTDTGHEWIEVENTGSDPVDISTWKLFEANVSHKLVSETEGVIPAGNFAVIADVPEKFRADNPGFSGLMFDSTFSLGNEGETLVLKDQNGADIDTVSYFSTLGGQGDGNSLQKSNSVWIAARPTPGAKPTEIASQQADESSEEITEEQEETGVIKNIDKSSTHSSQAVANISMDMPELVVTSGRPRVGFVGAPLYFEAKVKTLKHIPAGNNVGNSWTLGDGTQESGQFISHIYEFPGDYIVILNSAVGGASAVSKTKVKILEPHISLGNVENGAVELVNSDSHELNIGGWSFESGDERRYVPQDTIIAPRTSIYVSVSKLGFRKLGTAIKLANPSGRVVAERTMPRIISAEDILITLPPGMTEAVLREKLRSVQSI
jgi:hypothetical protein